MKFFIRIKHDTIRKNPLDNQNVHYRNGNVSRERTVVKSFIERYVNEQLVSISTPQVITDNTVITQDIQEIRNIKLQSKWLYKYENSLAAGTALKAQKFDESDMNKGINVIATEA